MCRGCGTVTVQVSVQWLYRRWALQKATRHAVVGVHKGVCTARRILSNRAPPIPPTPEIAENNDVLSRMFFLGICMVRHTCSRLTHLGRFMLDVFWDVICSTFVEKQILKSSPTYPKWSHKVPNTFPNMSETKKTKICTNIIRKCSTHLRKCVPNIPQILQTYDKKTVPAVPGIETGTLRIRLQPLSASNPIGLIPSQQIGSPELSYESELEPKTHRNNLVAEKVTWAFSQLKKHFSEKQALC